ncbi:hypothetical protein GF386_06475 [Candidatus Pacearchaeota archaeon]|nr:hypothetical protein [Candidatus Pacearchaeota archaeon]MBD3283737.1 hypothetical protein [Candidatus Pacearchaeota archaeon]
MIKKEYVCLLMIIILSMSTNIVSAKTSHMVTFDYSFSESVQKEADIDYSSVLLRVNTDRSAVCRYSEFRGMSYENMDYFDISSGKSHEKVFRDLDDETIYTYYIKCRNNSSNEPPESEFLLRVNKRVSANILLSEESPLSGGMVDVTLLTSKIVSQTPELSYSFDGVVYNSIPLEGSEKKWKGHLIIPESDDNSILSFKFKSYDLSGRPGNEIIKGNVFIVDTLKPKTITNLRSVGRVGSIDLEWHYDEDDFEEFKIYRSTSSNIDYTDFYESTKESFFEDSLVEKGKTYYYRVSAIDSAGNEGDLSFESHATVLLDNKTSSSGLGGLDPELRGRVDNFIVEIDSVIDEIISIESSIDLKDNREIELFSDLGLKKGISDSKGELNSLKRDVEKYKLQDLSEDELNRKIDSSTLRLNIIKKKVPEDIVVLDEDSEVSEIEEKDIEEVILEMDSQISDSNKKRNVRESLKLKEDSGLKINSDYYVIEVVYLDGTKKEMSVVKKVISAELERDKNTYLVEVIPKSFVESASEINVHNINYQVIKEDPIISFESDAKEIIYSSNKRSSVSKLKDTKLVLVRLLEDSGETSGITGYFFLNPSIKEYSGLFIGFLIIIALFVYFFYLKNNRPSDLFLRISGKLKESFELLEKGELDEAEEIYKSLKNLYKSLTKKEKKILYRDLDLLRNKILVSVLESGIEKLKKDRDKELLRELEKIYKKLSDEFKLEVSYFFEKVRKDVENEK